MQCPLVGRGWKGTLVSRCSSHPWGQIPHVPVISKGSASWNCILMIKLQCVSFGGAHIELQQPRICNTRELTARDAHTHTYCQDGKHRDYWVKREKTVSEPCVAPKGCWFRWPEINGTSDCGKWPGDDKYWIGIWLRISSLLKLLPCE